MQPEKRRSKIFPDVKAKVDSFWTKRPIFSKPTHDKNDLNKYLKNLLDNSYAHRPNSLKNSVLPEHKQNTPNHDDSLNRTFIPVPKVTNDNTIEAPNKSQEIISTLELPKISINEPKLSQNFKIENKNLPNITNKGIQVNSPKPSAPTLLMLPSIESGERYYVERVSPGKTSQMKTLVLQEYDAKQFSFDTKRTREAALTSSTNCNVGYFVEKEQGNNFKIEKLKKNPKNVENNFTDWKPSKRVRYYENHLYSANPVYPTKQINTHGSLKNQENKNNQSAADHLLKKASFRPKLTEGKQKQLRIQSGKRSPFSFQDITSGSTLSDDLKYLEELDYERNMLT